MSSGRLVLLAFTILIPLCAMLAAFGFRGRTKVVGVDLGTTFSVVAVRDSPEYTVRAIAGPDGPLLASAVAFGPEGALAVGAGALQRRFAQPQQVIFNAKRFIGKAWDDEALQEERRTHPFSLVQRSENISEAWFDVAEADAEELAVSPEEVGSLVIGELLRWVAKDLGHKQVKPPACSPQRVVLPIPMLTPLATDVQVNQAVIAVPADFGPRQRKATARAFKMAGLKVARVLEEPTAAALAYDLHRKENVNYILVYDFGGGTLDVSILFVNEGSVQVIGSAGDSRLGGSDFDLCLGRHFLDVLSTSASTSALKCAATKDLLPCGTTVNRALAEQAKIKLTDKEAVEVSCVAETGPGQCQKKSFHVSRTDFRGACEEEFLRSRKPIEAALEAVQLQASEIDEVVMVGGSSRIPAIRALVMETLDKDRLNVEIDPDLTVAIGAASVVD
eukprot:scaffold330_cov246-Pinguiococcus_pyrenoidosus.AAC.16